MVYYINSDIQSVDDVTEVAAATDMRHSTKAIVIENTDGSSSAETVLPVKSYTKANAIAADDSSGIADPLTVSAAALPGDRPRAVRGRTGSGTHGDARIGSGR